MAKDLRNFSNLVTLVADFLGEEGDVGVVLEQVALQDVRAGAQDSFEPERNC